MHGEPPLPRNTRFKDAHVISLALVSGVLTKPKRVWDAMETLSSEFGKTTGENNKIIECILMLGK